MRVLITNPGRKNYFINFLLDIKKNFIKNLNIHIADIDSNCSTFHMNKLIKTHILPTFKNKKKYVNSIKKIIKKEKIKLIIPVTDLDLGVLSEIKKLLSKYGCNILISNKKIINICIDKEMTFNFLKKNKFYTPKIHKNKKENGIKFPVIIKEQKGNGSKGLFIIKDRKTLQSLKLKNLIIQKFIKGKEYNLDILNDFNGNYLDHCCKLKLEMRDGETFKAKIIDNKKFDVFAKKISSSLKHVGNLDCDFIYDKKKFYIIDLNPRFGGGYPFTHISGKNYLYKILCLILNCNYNIKKIPTILTGMKSLGLNYYS